MRTDLTTGFLTENILTLCRLQIHASKFYLVVWKRLDKLHSVWRSYWCFFSPRWNRNEPSLFLLPLLSYILLIFRGITMQPGMPPAPKTLFHKSQHVALPEVPSGLFGPIVTAPWGSYLPGCTKTKRKLLYPFHLPDIGSLELLSCGLQMICYFDCNNNFFQKAAVTTRFTAPLHCMAWFRFYSDRLFYWLLNAMIACLHTQANHKQI